MKKSIIIYFLFLSLAYASNPEIETIELPENYKINEVQDLSLSEFLNTPIEEL